MSTKYTNLTYAELMELAPRGKPFQIRVESNAYNLGGPQILWAITRANNLDTLLFNQLNINGIDYAYSHNEWPRNYKGTFDLIIHHLDDTTLEKFEVGDEVEILECAKNSEGFDRWTYEQAKQPGSGNIFKIIDKKPSYPGPYPVYHLENQSFGKFGWLPSDRLRKVVSKGPKTESINIGGETFLVSEELTNALKNLKPIK